MNYTNLISETLDRGVTYRYFPGGKRAMVHRWNFRKIKGSHPLRNEMKNNITRKNSLFDALVRKGKRQP